jgi:hypothetical protein
MALRTIFCLTSTISVSQSNSTGLPGFQLGILVFAFETGPTAGSDLFDAIPRRQSTRAEYDGRVGDVN